MLMMGFDGSRLTLQTGNKGRSSSFGLCGWIMWIFMITKFEGCRRSLKKVLHSKFEDLLLTQPQDTLKWFTISTPSKGFNY
ncbi:hypothetical protein ACH5RR_021569, partial [Cinchona calisaya]